MGSSATSTATSLQLSGWGKTTSSVSTVYRASRPDQVSELITKAGPRGVSVRGMGRSSGDAAQNAGGDEILLTGGFRSPALVRVDWEHRTARIAGGASLVEVMRELLAQGWYLPVVGRTAHITVGGAVASDLHGPGHLHHGSLAAITDRIELIDGQGELRVLEPHGETAGAFWATFGGMGLTGVVVAIEVRVISVSSAWVTQTTRRCESLVQLLSDLDQTAKSTDYSYARLDTTARGSSRGRGVVVSARHAGVNELPDTRQATALEFTHADTGRMPRRLPEGALNSRTSRFLHTALFRSAPALRRDELVPAALFFHPADQPTAWNGIRSDQGIVAYQCIVPDDSVELLVDFLGRLNSIDAVSQQGILQRFGPGVPSPLSFPQPGWSLAIDFPVRGDLLSRALDDFDEQIATVGGRTYLASDARLRPSMVPVMYPKLDNWRAIRSAMDPEHRFISDLSRRLGL